MSRDNPTPQAEECDRAAVAKYHDDVFDRGRFCMSPPSLEEHFAAHRHSAVAAALAKREKEIVELIRSEVDGWRTVESLIKKIQTGGGA